MERRTFLATGLAGASIGTAGCLESSPPSSQSLVPYEEGASDAWQRSLGTVQHNSYNPGTKVPDKTPSLEWETTELEEYSPPPVVIDGQLYATELHTEGPGRLAMVVFDLQSGSKLWTREEVIHPPIVTTNGVYGAGPDTLYAFSSDGSSQWERSLGKVGSFVVGGSTAYAISNETGTAYALDLTSGETKWRVSNGYRASAAVLSEESIVFGNDQGEIIAIARSGGSPQWHTSIESVDLKRLTVANGSVYMTGGYRLDLRSGEVLDEFGWHDPPVFTDKLELSWTTELAASSGGRRLWQHSDPGGAYPTMADGCILSPSYTSVNVYDASTGNIKWKKEVGDNLIWAVPAQNRIIVQGADGYLGVLQ